jgi:aminoglycoside phosphotransferase (APT) family kinase protein
VDRRRVSHDGSGIEAARQEGLWLCLPVRTLPVHVSDLTPAWLSEVLDLDVVDVTVLDHASATNQRLRLGLSYAPAVEGPASLFVKLASEDAAHREMIGASSMGEREARFYVDVAPAVDLRVPGAYYASSADDGSFALLLEDLAAGGCAFSDGSWGVTADAAATALEELARFHASFEDPAVRAAVAPWLATPQPQHGDFVAQLMRTVLDENADVVTPAYIAAGELYIEHHARLTELWDTGPQTYIHGDTHIGNVFLDRGRVGFLDWGLSRVSTHLRDVSYFLTMTVDPEERRRSERDLLRLYLDALRTAGGADIAFDEAWAAHRVQAGYTVVATFLAFMPSYAGDGQALGIALRRHSELALDDLEAVDAIRAAVAS